MSRASWLPWPLALLQRSRSSSGEESLDAWIEHSGAWKGEVGRLPVRVRGVPMSRLNFGLRWPICE